MCVLNCVQGKSWRFWEKMVQEKYIDEGAQRCLHKDEGKVEIFGREYGDMNPKQAQEAGVAIIHQELNMCRHLSVTENMFLGREKVKDMVLSNKEMEEEARKILDELKIDLDPHQVVGDLFVSKQQMVEIAKALSTHAKILIMDEPLPP
mgnify:CR=1 FL=1